MSKITSPPEVVERAMMACGDAAVDVLFDPYWEFEPALSKTGAERAAGELRELLPHVDNATLVLVCTYISGLAEGMSALGLAAGHAQRAFGYLAVMIGNDLFDDLNEAEAEQRIKAEEALDGLRAKLRGESPQAEADAA